MRYLNFLIKQKDEKYYLYGLTSNVVVRINPYTFQLIKEVGKKSPNEISQEETFLYNKLKKYGFIQKEGFSDVPFNRGKLEKLDLQIVSKCNLYCRHYLWSEFPVTELSYGEIKTILSDFKKLGGFLISITGGEPLLHKDILKILKLCRDLNFQITISTNGLLISNSLIDNFKKFQVARVIVSLDGLKESHEYIRSKNTFDKTVTNIKSLTKNNIEVAVRMMYYKKSIPCYKEFRNFCKNLGVKTLITAPITEMGKASKNKELLLSKKELKQYYSYGHDQSILPTERSFILACRASKEAIYISSEGNVYPCPLLFDFKLGNVTKRRLTEIYKSPNRIFNVIKNFSYKDAVCGKCSKFTMCQGGCRGRAYLNGNIYGKDPFACAAYLEDY